MTAILPGMPTRLFSCTRREPICPAGRAASSDYDSGAGLDAAV